jgi:hypothetical protein
MILMHLKMNLKTSAMQTSMKTFTLITTLFAGIALLTSAPANIWYMVHDRHYRIPREASLLSFDAASIKNTQWVYGSDNLRFYYQPLSEPETYYTILKSQAKTCPDFDALDFNTWCKTHITRNQYLDSVPAGVALDHH